MARTHTGSPALRRHSSLLAAICSLTLACCHEPKSSSAARPQTAPLNASAARPPASDQSFGRHAFESSGVAKIAAAGRAELEIRVPVRFKLGLRPPLSSATDAERDAYAVSAGVEDLRSVLSKMTGASFSVVSSDDLSRGFVVGTPADFARLSLPHLEAALAVVGNDTASAQEAFYVRTEPQRVMIAGNTGYGIGHGVASVLRELGYRRLLQGKNWEIIPHKANLELDLHFSDRPAFLLRNINPLGGDVYFAATTLDEDRGAWLRSLLSDGASLTFHSSHAWQGLGHIVFSGKRGSYLFDEHPEYVMGFGASHAHTGLPYPSPDSPDSPDYQFDVSQPAVREVFLEYARQQVAAQEKARAKNIVVGLEPSDGSGWYAQDIAHPNWYRELGYTAPDWRGTPSDHVFGLANFVSDHLSKEFPDKHVSVSLLAYNDHAPPPHFKLFPNVMVSVEQGFCGPPGCGARLIDEWRATGQDRFIIEDYYSVWVWNHAEPPSAISTTPEQVRQRLWNELYQKGVRAINAEAQTDMGLNGLGYYLFALGMWNPLADFEALRRDFVDQAFGPAAREMSAYYDLLTPDKVHVASISLWSDAVRHLDSAGKIARREHAADVERRIDEVKYYWYYLYLLRKLDDAPDDADLRTRFFDLFFKQGPSYSISWFGFRHELDARLGKWHQPMTALPWKGSLEASGCTLRPNSSERYECSDPHWTEYGYRQSEVDAFWKDVSAYFAAPPEITPTTPDLVPVSKAPGLDMTPRVSLGTTLSSRSFDVWLYSFHGEPVELKWFGFVHPEAAKHLEYSVTDKDEHPIAQKAWSDCPAGDAFVLRAEVPHPGAYRVAISHDVVGFRLKPTPGYPIAFGGTPRPGFPSPNWTQTSARFYVPNGTRALDFELAVTAKNPTLEGPDGSHPTLTVRNGSMARGAFVTATLPENADGFWKLNAQAPGSLNLLYPHNAPAFISSNDTFPLLPRAVAAADHLAIRDQRFDPVRHRLTATPGGAASCAGTYEEVLSGPDIPATLLSDGAGSSTPMLPKNETAVFRSVEHPSTYLVRTAPQRAKSGSSTANAAQQELFVIFDAADAKVEHCVSVADSVNDELVTRSRTRRWVRVGAGRSQGGEAGLVAQ